MYSPLDYLLVYFHSISALTWVQPTRWSVCAARALSSTNRRSSPWKKHSRKVREVGARAKEMWSKNPKDILIVRPLRDGVISEYEITARMLDYLIRKAHEQTWVPIPRPRVVVGIPSGVTEVEKRAVIEARWTQAHAKRIWWKNGGRRYRSRIADSGNTRQHDCGCRWRHNGSRAFFARWNRYQSLDSCGRR